MFVITNIVCTANLNVSLNLAETARRLVNCEYDPRKFNALKLRFRHPNTTILLFRSGKLVCTGAKQYNQCRKAIRKCARIIALLNHRVAIIHVKIQNIIASARLSGRLNLDIFYDTFKPCAYSIEIFPGLTYKTLIGSVVLFQSGRFNIVGCKTLEAVKTLYNQTLLMYELL